MKEFEYAVGGRRKVSVQITGSLNIHIIKAPSLFQPIPIMRCGKFAFAKVFLSASAIKSDGCRSWDYKPFHGFDSYCRALVAIVM